MLKITVDETNQLTKLKVEGKLSGPWVEELERVWGASTPEGAKKGLQLAVDICGVTFIDTGGRELLARMYRQGVQLLASGCMNRSIVEGIKRAQPAGGTETHHAG
jgi:hypothetical protein